MTPAAIIFWAIVVVAIIFLATGGLILNISAETIKFLLIVLGAVVVCGLIYKAVQYFFGNGRGL